MCVVEVNKSCGDERLFILAAAASSVDEPRGKGHPEGYLHNKGNENVMHN